MGLKLEISGGWKRAGIKLNTLKKKLRPAFEIQMREDGEFILGKLVSHIDKQDLDWTPLAESTIRQKNGDETIMVETGSLRDGLVVRKVKSKEFTLFIGASPWKTHKPSGMKMSDLMIYLEYGTQNMPPRPLLQPTLEEVEDLLKKHWNTLMKNLVK